MMTVEFHVGAHYTGRISCTREKPVDVSAVSPEWYVYSYEYYVVGKEIIKGTVKHHSPNGAIALLKEICEDIESKGGK